MPKYYISCGSLNIIYSTMKSPRNACRSAIWECNENDMLDEYFYVDERGYRNEQTQEKGTIVIPADEIISEEGWTRDDN